MRFLDKIKRFFRKDLTPPIGIIACATYVVVALINIVVYLIQLQANGMSLKQSSFMYLLINLIIDCVFYLLVCNYFRKASENYFYAYYAMILITVSTYIIPIIFQFIEGIAVSLEGGGLTALLVLVGSIISAILGILYFIFMLLEVKNKKRTYQTLLLVIGGLICGIACYNFVVNMFNYSLIFTRLDALDITNNILWVVSSVIELAFASLYLLYAIDIKRIRTRGY